MIQRLQNQVRQLQGENLQLRRAKFGGSALSQSFTDLANSSFNELVSVRGRAVTSHVHVRVNYAFKLRKQE